MRDFAKVSPSVWRSKKFRSLPNDTCRYVYLYLLTCPHANSAGCFDLHPQYASADMGLSVNTYLDCLDTVSKAGLIEFDWDENTVFIANWIEFNGPANPKHALGILSQLDQASSERLKVMRFQELEAEIRAKKFDREASIRNAIALFCEPYRDCIPTETRDRDQTERETETRPDQTETREKSRAPQRPAAPNVGAGLGRNDHDPAVLYDKLAALGEAVKANATKPPDAGLQPSRLLETGFMNSPVSNVKQSTEAA